MSHLRTGWERRNKNVSINAEFTSERRFYLPCVFTSRMAETLTSSDVRRQTPPLDLLLVFHLNIYRKLYCYRASMAICFYWERNENTLCWFAQFIKSVRKILIHNYSSEVINHAVLWAALSLWLSSPKESLDDYPKISYSLLLRTKFTIQLHNETDIILTIMDLSRYLRII